jgi:hypothetical protein
MGEGTREAPAQAELRPTSAGLSVPYDAIPQELLG